LLTHFEINSADPAELHDFYAAIFGWSLVVDEADWYADIATQRHSRRLTMPLGFTSR